MMLRVAMAGAGFASGLHLAGWKRVANAVIVAICDPDCARAQARACEFGIDRVFDDVATMLDEVRPDALDIVSPLATHVPLCRLAAARGIDICCQKPLAASVGEARALADEVEGKVRLMVHENWRFRTQYRAIKRWRDQGELGDIVSTLMQVRASGLLENDEGVRPQLVRQPFCAELPRFMIAETLIHQLDVLRWLVGPLGVVSSLIGRRCPAIRGEDHALIVLKGERCWSAVDGSYVAPGAPPTPTDRLEITGTRGVALFEGGIVRLRAPREQTLEVDVVAGYADSYAAAIAHFADALLRDTPFETDVRDNLATLALVEDAYAKAVWLT